MNRFDKWPKEKVDERILSRYRWGNTLCWFDEIHLTVYELALTMSHQPGWTMQWDADNDSITCVKK